MNKENSVVHSMKTDNKPSYPPAECWSPSIEKQFSSLTIKTSKPPTYHIDLSECSYKASGSEPMICNSV